VDDPKLPITSYNYTVLRDRLRKKKIRVSVPTIIQRAKQLECYKPQRPPKRAALWTLFIAAASIWRPGDLCYNFSKSQKIKGSQLFRDLLNLIFTNFSFPFYAGFRGGSNGN
jgi:hypothetical protein